MKVNIAYWLDRNSAIYRDKCALLCEGQETSYRELQHRVAALATVLGTGKGVRPGDRVGALMFNQKELIELLFACARLGAIVVPLSFRLADEELRLILNDCEPVALLYDRAAADRGKALAADCTSIVWALEVGGAETSYEQHIAEAEPQESIPAGSGGDDPLEIMYTAGTTGEPKGVVLTHNNVFWQTINGWSLGLSPDVVALALLPLFHVGGLNGSVMPPLHIGGTVVLHRTFDPTRVLSSIREEGINGVLGVPTVFQMLAQLPAFDTEDLSHCAFLSGGAPLPDTLLARYHQKGLDLRQGFGLTETSPGVTGMGPGDGIKKPGSVGRPLLYCEVRVADLDGEKVPSGEVGEIQVKGPNVMAGYWNRPEQSQEALRDGWLRTGDLGWLDEDGFLFIAGRKKEMIISGGENIYPAEIENLLAGHPKVSLSAVVGRPDPKWGEIPVAVISKEAGQDLTEAEVLAFCAEKLATFKVPKEVCFVDSIPLTGAGKVARAVVAEMVASGAARH